METEDGIHPAKKSKIVSSDSSSKPGESLAKEEKDNDNAAMVVEQKEESKPVPPEQHKVKVGKLEYPAHPFTVRVSYLHVDTEEMDLVDVFRPKCGAIVHAKITRDKHHHDGKGKSKGWGLIQFEQRESVEKALALSEIIGIREKLVTVDRYHMPAVGLIPPGMHRVNPKGEGSFSKRNQKRKEQWMGTEHASTERASEPESKQDHQSKTNDKTAKSSGMSVLAFRPRGVRPSQKHGVRQSQKHRNVKLSLTDD
jgi:RNA recognition motif-containing protein